jgi:hypothetical protein
VDVRRRFLMSPFSRLEVIISRTSTGRADSLGGVFWFILIDVCLVDIDVVDIEEIYLGFLVLVSEEETSFIYIYTIEEGSRKH